MGWMDVDDGPRWELKIEIRAKDLRCLRRCLSEINRHIAKAETADTMTTAGVGSGEGNFTERFCVTAECPAEVKVKELRRQADELEAAINRV